MRRHGKVAGLFFFMATLCLVLSSCTIQTTVLRKDPPSNGVPAAVATKVVVTALSITKFQINTSVTLTIEVQDSSSALMTDDNSTLVTFSPSLSAALTPPEQAMAHIVSQEELKQ